MKWFKHDSNARGDEKIEKLLMKYGVEGYGLYFYCVEIIAGNLNTDDITFELKHDAETIGYRLKMDTLRVEEIMKWMVNAKLFQLNPKTKRIICYGLAKRLDVSTSNNPEFKKLTGNINYQKLLENNSSYQGLVAEETRREEKRRDKNKRDVKKTAKHRHGDKVLLTDDQYKSLCEKHGKNVVDGYIRKVNDYCVMHGKSYVDYKRGIETFIRRDKERGDLKVDPVQAAGWKCEACGKTNHNTMSFCTYCKAVKEEDMEIPGLGNVKENTGGTP